MSPCCWRWSGGRKTSPITVRDGSSQENTLALPLHSFDSIRWILLLYEEMNAGEERMMYIRVDKRRCTQIFMAAWIQFLCRQAKKVQMVVKRSCTVQLCLCISKVLREEESKCRSKYEVFFFFLQWNYKYCFNKPIKFYIFLPFGE